MFIKGLCKNSVDKRWRHFNDESVTTILKRDHIDYLQSLNAHPYILFYKQVTNVLHRDFSAMSIDSHIEPMSASTQTSTKNDVSMTFNESSELLNT